MTLIRVSALSNSKRFCRRIPNHEIHELHEKGRERCQAAVIHVVSSPTLLLRRLKSLVDIVLDVFHIFEANRKAHVVGRDARFRLLFSAQLLVGG